MPNRIQADQICINQEDILEKEHQVAKMSDIFSKAGQVLVWLGEESDFMHLTTTLSAIRALSEFTEAPTMTSIHAFLKERATNQQVERAIDGMCSIYGRPWFSRLWVRQEVALAKMATFFCGAHAISLKTLARTCDLLLRARAGVSFEDWSESTAVNHDAWRALPLTVAFDLFDLVRVISAKPSIKQSLLDAIRLSIGLKYAKSEDRVYAILPLSSAASNRTLLPDYRKPLGRLWRECAAYMLKDHMLWNELRGVDQNCPAVVMALSATQEDSQTIERPSWAPELDMLGERSSDKIDHYQIYSGRFSAGGQGEFCPIIDQNGREDLKLRGCLCASVLKTLPDSRQSPAWEMRLRTDAAAYWEYIRARMVPWYIKCRAFATQHGWRDQQVPMEFSVLLTEGIDVNGTEAVTRNVPDFKTFSRLGLSGDSLQENGVSKRQIFEDLSPFIDLSPWGHDTLDEGRIMAAFSDNRIGWVPETTKQGDLVFLLEGAPFPFIVRKSTTGSAYTIVGDAYVHGIMDGSLWKEKESEMGIYSFD